MIEPHKKNPFGVLNEKSFDAVQHEIDLGREHAWVKFTLGQVGLAASYRALMNKASLLTGSRLITFSLFDDEFPSFPVRFSCVREFKRVVKSRKANKEDREVKTGPLHRDPTAFHPEWFKNFMRLPFMRHYEEFFSSLGPLNLVKPVGLVFPRKGFKQGMVIHNGEMCNFVGPQSSCHLYVGGGKKPMNLVVQPFQSLLDHIHKVQHWKPVV